MIYKKNWITFSGYSIFALFLMGMYILYSDLFNDLSENNIIINICVPVVGVLLCFILFLTSSFASFLVNHFGKSVSIIIYRIIWWFVFVAAIAIRLYYSYLYADDIMNDTYNILIFSSAFCINILKLLFMFIIARVSIGRLGGIFALFLNSFLEFEITTCKTLNYETVSSVIVFLVVLLYVLYFKRCNNDKKNSAITWMLVVSMMLVISAGIGFSIYLDYSIAIPVILLICLIISMLFAGIIHAFVLFFGTVFLCIAMYFGTVAYGYDYGQLLDNEIEYRLSKIENVIDEPECALEIVEDRVINSVKNNNSFIVEMPGGYYFDYYVVLHRILIILGFSSTIIMFLKKRSSLFLYMIYTPLVYLFNANILSCCILMICFMVQSMYKTDKEELESIINLVDSDMITDDDVINDKDECVEKVYLDEEQISYQKEIDDEKNLDKYIIEEAATLDEAAVTEEEDILAKLPIPKAIISYDEDNSVKIKRNNNDNQSFDNDLWKKRKERIQNKITQKGR